MQLHSVEEPKENLDEDDAMDEDGLLEESDSEIDDVNNDRDYVQPEPKPKVKVDRSTKEEFLRQASQSTEVTAVTDK